MNDTPVKRSKRIQDKINKNHNGDSNEEFEKNINRPRTRSKAQHKETKSFIGCNNNSLLNLNNIGNVLEQTREHINKPIELVDEYDLDMFSKYRTDSPTTEKTEIIKQRDYFKLIDKELRVSLTDIQSNIKNSKNSQNNKICEQENKEKNLHKKYIKDFQKIHIYDSDSDNSNNVTADENTSDDSDCENKSNFKHLRNANHTEYFMQSDDYFTKQSAKSITSKNTLSKIRKHNLSKDEFQKILSKDHIPEAHKKGMEKLVQDAVNRFDMWMTFMEAGFNVLLYGLGSKRLIINKFHEERLQSHPALIINGFYPNLTLKEILDSIIIEIMELESSSNQNECLGIIRETMNANPDDRLYLLIHNIDGTMLRSDKAQEVLSLLASIPNVHLLASIDHINAPLLWDNMKRIRFNFFWEKCITFLPYDAETSYETSLFVNNSGTLALLSLKNVFLSLTSNAKNIYILLAKYQLKNKDRNYSGMAFKDLYKETKEAMLVSSDSVLRAQLIEFKDHELIKFKRNYEGVEELIIPLDNSLLEEFLKEQEETT